MKENLKSGIKGLILGDGLSRQNSVERLALTSQRRVNRFQTLTRFSFENGITTFPEPYVHAFPEKLLKLAPGDDCEWFYFSAINTKKGLPASHAWKQLSKSESQIRARLGTKTALRNLAKGLEAPESGHDNPHYFDSISMLRSAAIASMVQESLEKTLKAVTEDVEQTHSLDGIWCAKAIAALVYSIKNGDEMSFSLNLALQQIPDNCLTSQILNRTFDLCSSASDELHLSLILEEELVDRIYCYPYSAPELLALIYSKFWLDSDPQLKFSSTFLHRRHNDSLPALMGFLLGLKYGDSWLPEISEKSFKMDGLCIPDLKGRSLIELLD